VPQGTPALADSCHPERCFEGIRGKEPIHLKRRYSAAFLRSSSEYDNHIIEDARSLPFEVSPSMTIFFLGSRCHKGHLFPLIHVILSFTSRGFEGRTSERVQFFATESFAGRGAETTPSKAFCFYCGFSVSDLNPSVPVN
jgi:hypothetical protein